MVMVWYGNGAPISLAQTRLFWSKEPSIRVVLASIHIDQRVKNNVDDTLFFIYLADDYTY